MSVGRWWFRRLAVYACILFLLGVIIVSLSPFWMAPLGRFLVNAEIPPQAEMAVLLAGDPLGERMTTAALLVEAKLVPKVLVSGPAGPYGTSESDLAVEWAVRKGKLREWFVPLPIAADSTTEEARVLIQWLRDHKIRRIDLVTSNFHTRRAGQIWRRFAPDLEIHVVAAPNSEFDPEHWWLTRRGQKIFALEWQKTIGWMVGF